MLQEDDIPLHLLQTSDLVQFDGYLESFFIPAKAEIQDRGNLPVTHLKIVTLVYVAMNFMIYIFWWNKPLNVHWPVRVFQKSLAREVQPQDAEQILEAWQLTWKAIHKGLETTVKFITGYQDDDVNLSHEDRVPRFCANSTGSFGCIEEITGSVMLLVGVCFGAIHCITWGFSFPTHMGLMMWQISSVAITAMPNYIFLVMLLATLVDNMNVGVTDIILILPPVILYMLAQVATFVLAFTSLRDLPSGAYKTVHWTTFIPHV